MISRRHSAAPDSAASPAATAVAGLVLLAALVTTAVFAPRAAADDRQLFRETSAEPYVFILLDISGSMYQSVPCTQESMEAGECVGYRSDILHANVPCGQAEVDAGLCLPCPPGACLPRMIGDDPSSKMRIAKEAIYALMDETDDIHFGFATFDQDELRVYRKHWWYRVAAEQPVDGFIQLRSGRYFPPAGQEDVFGKTWSCNRAVRNGPDNSDVAPIGCNSSNPADLGDRYEYERIRRLPKLGDDCNLWFIA